VNESPEDTDGSSLNLQQGSSNREQHSDPAVQAQADAMAQYRERAYTQRLEDAIERSRQEHQLSLDAQLARQLSIEEVNYASHVDSLRAAQRDYSNARPPRSQTDQSLSLATTASYSHHSSPSQPNIVLGSTPAGRALERELQTGQYEMHGALNIPPSALSISSSQNSAHPDAEIPVMEQPVNTDHGAFTSASAAPQRGLSDPDDFWALVHEQPILGRGQVRSRASETSTPAVDPTDPLPRPNLRQDNSFRQGSAICDQCRQERDDVSYCPVCSFNYCCQHWETQLLHDERRSVGGVPHEKTDPNIVRQILSIVEPTASEQEQENLHRADEETTWFGVLPDPSGELLFHDFGRYDEFLAQSDFRPRSGQFPSLISFVGKTGAGKSTIVKGLIRLFSNTAELATPVVGMTRHLEVPTSGEVHLYWDSQSMLTNRPLMYADCEGLGAGSQDPMAARATAIRDNDRSNLASRLESRPGHSSTNRMTPDMQSQHSLEWATGSQKNSRGITRKIHWLQQGHRCDREFIVENLYPRLLYTFSDIVVLVMRNAK
jgi:hypothetical protein